MWGETEGNSIIQQGATDHLIVHRLQEEAVAAEATEQQVLALAFGVEDFIVATCPIHEGAGTREDALTLIRALDGYIRQLDAIPGQRRIGGRIEQDRVAGALHCQAHHKVEFLPVG